MSVKPIPDGYHAYTPYFVVEGAVEFMEFLKLAFGAVECFRIPHPDGKLGHAEVRIGDSVVMLADAHPPANAARQLNGMLYVDDVDNVYARAVSLGAKGLRPPTNMFYGDRMSGIADKWGNYWGIATHVEDVSPEEMDRRMAAQPHDE